MNKKYLFGMLVSGAMLAACTADDLNTAPVAQDVNPSAPVFTVSLDNGDLQNRAEYVTEGNAEKVRFEAKKDLLSLYHGVTAETDFKNYMNAIYQGDTPESGEEGVLEFTTKSMVHPGYAVMVYPADTTFNWLTRAASGAPFIQVPAEQSRQTNEKTPYMSEILNIAAYKDIADPANKDLDQNEMAGYGRTYDVVLKRAASLLKMNLIYTKPELKDVAEELTVIGVELNNEKTTNNGKFTLQIPVKVDEAAVHENKTEKATDKKAHPIWAKSSALDVDNIPTDAKGQTSVISTSDIENNVARLTLLPVSEDFSFENGKIVIKTNYGNIDLKAADELLENPFFEQEEEDATKAGWTFGVDKEKLTVADVIVKIMEGVSNEKAGEGRRFEGEYEGASRTLPVAFDATKLNLNGVHVQDDGTLNTLLKVYKALNEDKLASTSTTTPSKATLVLDGEKEGENAKKFVMSPETAKLLAEVTEKFTVNGTKYFQFTLCAEEAPCTAIQLKNEDDNKTATIYDLAGFYGNYTVDGDTHNAKKKYSVELYGKWTFANNVDENGAILATVLRRAETFTILKEGTLELGTLTVDVRNDSQTNDATDLTFKMVNNGTVNVTGKVRFSESLENFGTINIETTGDLIIQGNHTLTNREALYGEDGETAATGWDWKLAGVINNSGVLEVFENGEENVIENYGLLNIKTEKAVTLITRNGDSDAEINKPYASDNRMGTIFLTVDNAGKGTTIIKEATGATGTTISDKTQGVIGFVKYYSGTTVGNKFANYIIIDEDHKAKDGKLAGETYAEVHYGDYEVTGTVTYTGLVIGESVEIQINDGAKLEAKKYMLHNGYIRKIGTLSGNELTTGYYGSDGKGEIFSYDGGGQ